MIPLKPLIAVPIGDPAGVGPEIVAKAMVNKEVKNTTRCVVIGDKNVMERAIAVTGADLRIRVVENPLDGRFGGDFLNLIDMKNIDMSQYQVGKVNGMCGKAAYEYIEKAVELAKTNKVDAISTTPINKKSLRMGGIPYIGHTEIFGALTGTKDPLTMFEVRGLRAVSYTHLDVYKRQCI